MRNFLKDAKLMYFKISCGEYSNSNFFFEMTTKTINKSELICLQVILILL